MKHTYVYDGDDYYLVHQRTSDGYLIKHHADSNMKMLIRFNKVCDIIDVEYANINDIFYDTKIHQVVKLIKIDIYDFELPYKVSCENSNYDYWVDPESLTPFNL